MKKWLFLLTTSVYAALPPFAQSTKEIKTLLSEPHLQQLLGSAEPIRHIIRTETGYLLVTNQYTLTVDITYGSTHGIAGPVPFSFTYHEPILMSSSPTWEQPNQP